MGILFGHTFWPTEFIICIGWMRQSAAKVVSAEEFGKDLRHGQLIDVREKDEFKAAHI